MSRISTMREVYLTAQNNCGLQVGDYVKVTRSAENYEAGWASLWDSQRMDKTIGRIGIVKSFTPFGVEVSFSSSSWNFPYFVLEKVEKPAHQFKPFDRVLVRDNEQQEWKPDIFRYKQGDDYFCMTGWWKQCIPYEGNEHLFMYN